SSNLAAPNSRRPPPHQSTLGPVPPTPADWIEGQENSRSHTPAEATQADTNSRPISQCEGGDTAVPTSSTGSSSLQRTRARRDPSAGGIRERRSESRAAQQRNADSANLTETSNNPYARDMETAAAGSTGAKPADLVLPSPGGLTRKRTVKRGTPTSSSSQASPADGPGGSGRKVSYSSARVSPAELRINTRRVTSPDNAATPPFSPTTDATERTCQTKAMSSPVPPKALPTPPQRSSDDYLSTRLNVVSSERPISHILHTPNEVKSMVPPLQPLRSSAHISNLQSGKDALDRDAFATASTERHRDFILKESTAANDQDRLELFAQFIVTESRLRRDRYSAAFDAMAGDLLDLTRDLWKSYSQGRQSTTQTCTLKSSKETAIQQTPTVDSSAESITTASSPAVSVVNYTPRAEPESPSSVSSQEQGRGEHQMWDKFKPSLSPIPSMAMSTVPDTAEEDSRGRAPSRWWESDTGSQGRTQTIERSKRESKYMGVPKEAREQLQWGSVRSSPQGGTPKAVLQTAVYNQDEYPSEKAGWHEEEGSSRTPQYPYWNHSAPATPDPYKLDVSRLITLPPPYPRHYPAVNNNHPDLASIRQNHRLLADLFDVTSLRDSFIATLTRLRAQHQRGSRNRRSIFHRSIQDEVNAGIMTFSEAAAAEITFEDREAKHSLDAVQHEFDTFQSDIITPLHALLSERITRATATIDQLRSGLSTTANDRSPNQPQEEGDERPELLEKLTLLK
ncbi:hypothetical protein LTS18_009189, partial [Coniosporium uncinatum]